MGSRDIIQSLKMKRRQDRNRDLQIPDEAEPSAMLALAAREMRSGDVGIAIQCVNKALELSPNDKNALIARSKCYLLLGEPQKALQDAEAALNEKIKDPNNARAMYYKAEALYHLGDFELSLVYYYRGMRIRPEFDQFRLGVQKAKEAIQNILGNNSTPIPISAYVRSAPKPESPGKPSTAAGKEILTNEIKEKNNNIRVDDNESKKKFTSPINSEKIDEKRKNSMTTKRKVAAPNLLGQLNVDKKYLQDLLKCPDIKAGHQTSARHIISPAEEGIAFLETRQEFWRQQRSTHQPASK
ncbi:outer dynein arm-docking complex subunit 4 isoform X2 [Venturia canescens]|uniref:outer dynein arm-docking complex subunit 4 isoform X2 n=1 Tax=Venturia canescens TaxID=32260 RepID=UPI001C9D4301|nr:outer dynein arm-docking complex subunit 4 isoform X2 [Venturia canescens]